MPALVDTQVCDGCKTCLENCPTDSIKMVEDKAQVDKEACIDCQLCVDNCPQHAMQME